MIEIKRGSLIRELYSRPGIQAFMVQIQDNEEKCISYTEYLGELSPGDEVLLNTTAVSLELGSGGYHFIIAKLNSRGHSMRAGGHIMKLRYTPMQIKVLSVEEQDSPYHEQMQDADSLDKIPVLAGTLHSMLAPLCLELQCIKARIAYLMTDGAALPISFSNNVAELKKRNMLVGTVTVGNAFGGDLEAVNVYSGLLAARKVLNADVIIVSMGPGIVGTGTRWGFTGIEQGEILNAVDALDGIPIAVPRVSFADLRTRHYGLSHHTLTVLSRVCRIQAFVPLPMLEEVKMNYILGQMQAEKLLERHIVCVEDDESIINNIKNSALAISTMGRGVEEDKEFFLTLGAVARTTVRLINGEKANRVYIV